MLRAKKENEQTFIFKHYSVLGPILIILISSFVGFVLTMNVLGSDTQETGLNIAIPILVSGGLIVFSLFALHTTTFVFDRKTGQIKYNRKKLLGSSEEGVYSLSDVTSIRTERKVRHSRNGASVSYDYFLVFNNGSDLKLGSSRGGRSILTGSSSYPKPIQKLQNFLGVNIEMLGAPQGGLFGALGGIFSGTGGQAQTNTVDPPQNQPQQQNQTQNKQDTDKDWKKKWQ